MDEKQLYLLEAKKEFTKLLCYHMQKSLYQGFCSIWSDSKEAIKNNPQSKLTLYQQFQLNLKKVKIWNHDIIADAYNHIVTASGCDFLEDLIKKVFVLNTQLLACAGANQQRITLHVPKGEKFVHHCYQECAKVFYEQPWLFEDRPQYMSKVEQSKNLQEIYKLINTCIENKIKTLLPIGELLRELQLDLDSPSKVDKLDNVIRQNSSEQLTSISLPQVIEPNPVDQLPEPMEQPVYKPISDTSSYESEPDVPEVQGPDEIVVSMSDQPPDESPATTPEPQSPEPQNIALPESEDNVSTDQDYMDREPQCNNTPVPDFNVISDDEISLKFQNENRHENDDHQAFF